MTAEFDTDYYKRTSIRMHALPIGSNNRPQKLAPLSRQPPATIRHRGRTFNVQQELRIKGRPYWVIAQLGRAGRSRWQVYDPAARTLRVVHDLPDSPASRQQIASLQKLDHRGGAVPAILDCERTGKLWRVLTTWVEGESLAAYLQAARDGRKPWPSAYESTRLFRGFVHGLCQLHQFTASIHGDISPANLIVQAQPHALVLVDYGSAWPITRAHAQVTGEGATLGYAAPERLGEQKAGPLADQFSASVVYYELLTGKLPYEGMGGRAGSPENCEAFAGAFAPPSRLAVASKSVPPLAWRTIDALAEGGLRLEPQKRFTNSSQWRNAANEAWKAVGMPMQSSALERIGGVVADWLERFVKPGQR